MTPQITPQWVSTCLDTGPLSGPEITLPYSTVTTDSRKVTPNCLFVALKGDVYDGHDFIEKALEQGATGILADAKVLKNAKFLSKFSQGSIAFFGVEDSLSGYRKLAAEWRNLFRIPVIAVAGSVGKTTVKELTAAIFRGKYHKVLKTVGSQNGFIGIALTLLELRPEHEIAVIEIGIDDIHAMQAHLDIVRPTASILTAIGEEHLEKLQSIEIVAREEGLALSEVAKHGGITAINCDDPWIKKQLATLPLKNQTRYGLDPLEGRPANSIQGSFVAPDILVIHPADTPRSQHPVSFRVPLPGLHNARNLLGAVALALAHGMQPEEIRRGLEGFTGAEGRSQVRSLTLKGDQSIQVICDYYNANPQSMVAGFQVLKERKGRESWACLGDMRELGPNEESLHRSLAAHLIRLGIDHVLLYGPRMKWLLEELNKQKFPGKTGHFETHQALAHCLLAGIHDQDAVLIKGSRGYKMEEVWKVLNESPRSSPK